MTRPSSIDLVVRSGAVGSKRLGVALAALALSVSLSACGKATDPQTEARLAALEAKVDAADKRSQQALSMAASGTSVAPPADTGGQETFGEPADDGVTDGSADSAVYDNTIEAPPPPLIGPGN